MIKANTTKLIQDFIYGTNIWYQNILKQNLFTGKGVDAIKEPCIYCGITPSKMKELSDALKEIK